MLLDRLGREAKRSTRWRPRPKWRPTRSCRCACWAASVAFRPGRVSRDRCCGGRERDPENPQVGNDHAVVLMRLHRHGEARVILQDILTALAPTIRAMQPGQRHRMPR